MAKQTKEATSIDRKHDDREQQTNLVAYAQLGTNQLYQLDRACLVGSRCTRSGFSPMVSRGCEGIRQYGSRLYGSNASQCARLVLLVVRGIL
jgi:hypothetical protein